MPAPSSPAPTSGTRPAAPRSGLAASCRCTPTTGRRFPRSTPATSPRPSGSSRPPPATPWRTRTIRSCSSRSCSRSRSSAWRSSRGPRSTRKRWARRWPSWPRRIPPSRCAPTRRPPRPSSRGWASCISRSSSTGCSGNSPSMPTSVSLPVGHLRLTDVGIEGEFPEHPVDDDLEMQLAHPRDDGLSGLLVGAHLEGGILLGQLGERLAHLLLVDLCPRLDGDADHRLREDDRFQHDRVVLVGQGVAGGGLLEADGGGDVAGVDLGNLLAMVRMHL